MKLYLGTDHQGFHAYKGLINYLRDSGYDVTEIGDTKLNPDDDYPQFAGRLVAALLASDDADAKGILLCGSGQGMCMAANRFKGIRACLGYDSDSVKAARNDDDSNVLCLPAASLNKERAHDIVDTWLRTPFSAASRYIRRNKELDELT